MLMSFNNLFYPNILEETIQLQLGMKIERIFFYISAKNITGMEIWKGKQFFFGKETGREQK